MQDEEENGNQKELVAPFEETSCKTQVDSSVIEDAEEKEEEEVVLSSLKLEAAIEETSCKTQVDSSVREVAEETLVVCAAEETSCTTLADYGPDVVAKEKPKERDVYQPLMSAYARYDEGDSGENPSTKRRKPYYGLIGSEFDDDDFVELAAPPFPPELQASYEQYFPRATNTE